MRIELAKTAAVLCLSFLLASRCVAAESAESPDVTIGRHLAEMFQAGFVRSPSSLQQSQRIYESVRKDARTDARVDYAHGLLMLKQLKNKEAQADFLAATKQPGTPYRPAWQALIWSLFATKEYDDGYDAVLAYAKRIQNPDEFSQEERHDEIYWIGRIMSALELLLDSPEARESWLQTEEKLTRLLGADSIDVYNDGKEDVHVKHSLIEDEIRQAREKIKERKTQQIEKKLERDGKAIEAANERRASLRKSAAETKETYDEQSNAFKKQMQRAEKDMAFLERRGMTLMSTMLVLDQQINLIQQLPRNQNSNVNTSNAQRLAALQNQRFIYETEFQRVSALAQQVGTNAQQLAGQQSEFLDQHQKVAGELAEKDAANEKWKERTLKQVANLKKAETNEKSPASLEKLLAAKSLRSYIDLDPVAERDKVLASFGIKVDVKK